MTISDQEALDKSGHHTACDSLMRYAELLGFGDVHIKVDQQTGLKAIIAIHSLKRGPAIGGCRLVRYQSLNHAIEDALRLAYMMSYKAAINSLPHGGGKAVLIEPSNILNRTAYFEKFGEFVEELGGRYLTAVDSGTSPQDMDNIAHRTHYVTCTTNSGADGDPSPFTALGVRRGIEAAVKFKLKQTSLENIHIAIQGAGHVGYYLAKEVHALGAKITMTDFNREKLKRCEEEFGVNICAPDEIYDIAADVFSPCALGAILNLNHIRKLKTKIVAGSANNQLAHHQYGHVLHELGILYAPDFLINAGGLIHVAVTYDKGSISRSLQQIEGIYEIAYDIFEQAAQENIATNVIAERIAKSKLSY